MPVRFAILRPPTLDLISMHDELEVCSPPDNDNADHASADPGYEDSSFPWRCVLCQSPLLLPVSGLRRYDGD